MLSTAILERFIEPRTVAMVLAAVAAAATVYTLAMPLVEGDGLKKRMKAVASERERIRQRERARLDRGKTTVSLRQAPKAYMKQVVDRFKLGEWLGTDTAKKKLTMAGFRGQSAEVTFLFSRFIAPLGFVIGSVMYIFILNDFEWPLMVKVAVVVASAFLGVKSPELFLSNAIKKRQKTMKRAWPDALDLMLICVESGMSIEAAFRRVSQEIGVQSPPLAEELTLATAELSYLNERRAAYENLSARTGLETVRAVSTALTQAERYGTPLGTALRVLAQESRDTRMMEAEKKAAALPPKLTVPMILFFLPVIFVVIMTPALIQVFHWN